VHREIFKEAIMYFEPMDINSISQALEKAARLTPEQRENFMKKGKEIAGKFSWEKTARETLNAYESSLSL
jgi:glycosyltransferase involved in cell wall biosynthesis